MVDFETAKGWAVGSIPVFGYHQEGFGLSEEDFKAIRGDSFIQYLAAEIDDDDLEFLELMCYDAEDVANLVAIVYESYQTRKA